MKLHQLFAVLALSGVAVVIHATTPVPVVHGGAGVIKRDMTPAKEKEVRAALARALEGGYAQLKAGKRASMESRRH